MEYKFKTIIVDCDPLVYRCGHAMEHYDKNTDILNVEPLKNGLYSLNSMIRKCFRLSGTTNFIGYITGKNNFRMDIYPWYKENRVKCIQEGCIEEHPYNCIKNGHKVESKNPRPIYYKEIRDFLIKRWECELIDGFEADDACSMKQYELNIDGFNKECYNSIVWSIDKDFNNIPGWHGNYSNGEIYYVDTLQAKKNFYLQILTGDNSDGIPRIKKGWRQKETEQKIGQATTEKELVNIVKEEMKKAIDWESICKNSGPEDCYGDDNYKNTYITDEITWRGQLVHLLTRQEELWTIPN